MIIFFFFTTIVVPRYIIFYKKLKITNTKSVITAFELRSEAPACDTSS